MTSEGRRGGDTREKIQEVALELFAEQGYDKTSLREIAERLDVTKAALYYHFRTKDDILASLFDDYIAEIDALVEWARTQGTTTNEVRRSLVLRYAELLGDRGAGIVGFIQGNQSTMRELEIGQRLFERFGAFAEVLIDKSAPLKTQLKTGMAMAMLHMGMFAPLPVDATPEDRKAAAIEVILEMLPQD